MRKMMYVLLGMLFVTTGFVVANPVEAEGMRSETAVNQKPVKEETVHVYYFHTSRRCVTCMTIERVARNIVKDQYADDKKVVFKSVNIEEDENKKLAEKFKVAGSSLLVSCGKDKVDLTAKAFQYARSSPDKLQTALIAAVDKMLN